MKNGETVSAESQKEETIGDASCDPMPRWHLPSTSCKSEWCWGDASLIGSIKRTNCKEQSTDLKLCMFSVFNGLPSGQNVDTYAYTDIM